MTTDGAQGQPWKPLAVGSLLSVLLWGAAAWQPLAPWALIADNLHWTVAYAFGVWMVWRSVPLAEQAVDQRARRIFAIGLSLNLVGQLAYTGQALADWLPPLSVSDVFFFTLGPAYLIGFLSLLHEPGKSQVLRRIGLDILGAATAFTAFAIALYLPLAKGAEPLAATVSIVYPVLFFTAAATSVFAMLYQRQQLSAAGAAITFGLLTLAVAWMFWNVALLQGPVPNGSWMGLLYSMPTLVMAWGSAQLRTQINQDPGYDRLCEGILRMLPLTMMGLATAAFGLLALNERMDTAPRGILIGLGLFMLVLAVVRQTQQLGDRERLLAAERAVAEGRAALAHQALHDALTGLPNLSLLRDRAELAMAGAARTRQKVALMFIDLDQFKEVNDTLGHAAGDALLKHLAKELEAQMRQADTVARQGGDEFCIVLPGVESQDEAMAVAEKVMALSRKSLLVDGHDLPLHMSIGIALFPDDACDFDSLMQAADTAMYRAKSAGRKGYRFYDAGMNAEALARMQMRSRLAKALERGELSLRYQPQVNLVTGHIEGVEALMRWTSPDLGPVSPAQFIPVAEDSGLIVDMGAWALFEACRQASTWLGMGLPPIKMAVNISVLQFRRGQLHEQVSEALALTGLPAQYLELELTESVLMQEQDQVATTLDRLEALGVGLAIDDFGTGYSSLSYLKRLRVDKLKIDQSFVRDATESAGAAGIVRAVVQMADALGLRTLAEGVETEAQRDLLIACGCASAQGYLFAKPLSADELTDLLQKHPDQPSIF